MDTSNLNIENLNQLLEWLDNGGDERTKFDMRHWYDNSASSKDCGTLCCMGGYGDYILGGQSLPNPDNGYVDAFGLERKTADMLYYPPLLGYANVSAAWAARVVRNLIETGQVDWYGTAETEGEFAAAADMAKVSE